MELKEAIGSRRTFRFLLPHKPVELAKIQKMLEAARLASFWGNVQALRAVVVRRETVSDEVMAALFAPIAGFQIEQAPVVIVFDRLFHLDRFGTPFPRDPEVVKELTGARMLQEPAPVTWRQAELDYLQRALNLPDA